jgi:hypothetical protein
VPLTFNERLAVLCGALEEVLRNLSRNAFRL